MPRSHDFYPPQRSPLFTRLAQGLSPFGAHLLCQLDLQISPEDLEKLAALKHERYVLLPNHPTFDDGIVIFLLSTRLGELFHYLVAREVFEPWGGKMLQWLGAYSIRRGLGDRASVAQTLELLRQPASRLVIFPEGGCSFQNDTVMPFRPGAIQFPLQAMSKGFKHGEIPNFYLVPTSIKYRYTKPMNWIVERTLHRLEDDLALSPRTRDFYSRLRAIAERVMVNIERVYGLNSPQTASMDWNQRISRIKAHLLQQCEQKLNLTPIPNIPDRERVYKIQSVLASRTEDLNSWDSVSWATHREAKPNSQFPIDSGWTDDVIYRATLRLLNFDAIYDGYVAAAPTEERFLDTLTRLEREVFAIDRPSPKGHRHAIVRIGDPVNLKDYLPSYRHNRTDTVEALTQQMQHVVQGNLELE